MSTCGTRGRARDEITYVITMFILLLVVCAAIFNLTWMNENREVWIGVMATVVGTLMRRPKLRKSIKAMPPVGVIEDSEEDTSGAKSI